jgi:transposase InsO family protein
MSDADDAVFLVRSLLTQPQADAVLALHRWSDEAERWRELVHVLLNPAISLPDLQVRDIVDRLSVLGLLDPEAWTRTPATVERRRMVAELSKLGVEPAEAERAANILSEAARSLTLRFEGKAQRCLRFAGERALASLIERFDVPSLQDEVLREALIAWLQNTTSMPIPLADAHTRRFCRDHEVQLEDLVRAADRLDLNVAVLDDLIHVWAQAASQSEDRT